MKFLYNSEFDLTAKSLVTNSVVITRLLCNMDMTRERISFTFEQKQKRVMRPCCMYKNIMKKNIFNYFNNSSTIFKQFKATGHTSILSPVFKGRQF